MKQVSTNPEPEVVNGFEETLVQQLDERAAREKAIAVLREFWDRRRFLSRLSALGLLVAAAIAFLIPAQYESTTLLMPPDQQSSSTGALLASLTGKAGALLGPMAGDLAGIRSSGDLFIGILRSRTVEDRLIAKFELRKVYRDSNWEDARRDLEIKTGASEERKSGIITIRVTDRSPQRAAGMAREYVEVLNLVVAQLSTSAAHRERVFLEERLTQVNQDLESAEKEFSQFASKNTAIDIQAQGKAMVEAAATLQGQLIAAESELEGLKQIYSDENVRVRSVQARITELQHQLEKLGGKGEASSGTGQEAGSLYPSIRRLPLLGVTYADLFRRAKVQEAVFEVLTQQYELAKVQEAKEIPSVKVLDPANIPERKSFPPRFLIIILGGILALGLGVAWIFGSLLWAKVGPDDPVRRFTGDLSLSFEKTRLGKLFTNSSALSTLGNRSRQTSRDENN